MRLVPVRGCAIALTAGRAGQDIPNSGGSADGQTLVPVLLRLVLREREHLDVCRTSSLAPTLDSFANQTYVGGSGSAPGLSGLRIIASASGTHFM